MKPAENHFWSELIFTIVNKHFCFYYFVGFIIYIIYI